MHFFKRKKSIANEGPSEWWSNKYGDNENYKIMHKPVRKLTCKMLKSQFFNEKVYKKWRDKGVGLASKGKC